MKQILFEKINNDLTGARENYHDLIADKTQIHKVLKEGAQKVRDICAPFLQDVTQVGLVRL